MFAVSKWHCYIYLSIHHFLPPAQVVVMITGAFDLFNVGHVEALARAKKLGDFLLVGIHDDSTVNSLRGENFPIMNLHERALSVLSCKHVDEVIIGCPWKLTKDLITSMNVSIVAKGTVRVWLSTSLNQYCHGVDVD